VGASDQAISERVKVPIEDMQAKTSVFADLYVCSDDVHTKKEVKSGTHNRRVREVVNCAKICAILYICICACGRNLGEKMRLRERRCNSYHLHLK